MAIGNQLDLQIVVSGFQQAQSALGTLASSFSTLRDSHVGYTSAIERMNFVHKTMSKQQKQVAKSSENVVQVLGPLGQVISEVGGEGEEFKESLRDTAESLQVVRQASVNYNNVLLQTTGMVAGMATQFGISLVTSLRSASIEMEQLEIQLKTIGDVGENTTRSLERLIKMARLPGIDFQSAVQGVTQLRATGISAELAEQAVSNLGNALASVGGNPEDLKGVVRAFSQIQSKGKVYAEEIYQIAERLPQIRKIMLDVIGTADTELLAKEGFSANQFLMLITDGLARLPRVVDNTRNQLSNLKNEVFLLSASLGKELAPMMIKVLKGLSNVITSINAWSPAWKKFISISIVVLTGFTALIAILAPLVLMISALGSAMSRGARKAIQQAQANTLLAVTEMAVASGAVTEAVGLKAVETATNAVTIATGKATAMMIVCKIAMVALVAVGIISAIVAIGSLIYTFLNWGKKTKEVKTETEKLNAEIKDTKELLGTATEIKRFTNELIQQSLALNEYTSQLKSVNEELALMNENQKGTPEGQSLQAKSDRLTDISNYASTTLQDHIGKLSDLIAKTELTLSDWVMRDEGGKQWLKIMEGAVEIPVKTTEQYETWMGEFSIKLRKAVLSEEKVQRDHLSEIRDSQAKQLEALKDEAISHYTFMDEITEQFTIVGGVSYPAITKKQSSFRTLQGILQKGVEMQRVAENTMIKGWNDIVDKGTGRINLAVGIGDDALYGKSKDDFKRMVGEIRTIYIHMHRRSFSRFML